MSEAVRETPKKERPQFRNIHVMDLALSYRWPLGSIVSILHRVSGALLFLLLPVVLYLLQLSLRSEISFSYFHGIASHWFVKLVLLALIWAYMQHFCAGVRHLFMDVHIGIEKQSARASSIGVLATTVALTALSGLKLFGVF
ncbi:MAG: succinate dehydrogenase, cytochrome b556 subunit [Pseudomonadota bacterium]